MKNKLLPNKNFCLESILQNQKLFGGVFWSLQDAAFQNSLVKYFRAHFKVQSENEFYSQIGPKFCFLSAALWPMHQTLMGWLMWSWFCWVTGSVQDKGKLLNPETQHCLYCTAKTNNNKKPTLDQLYCVFSDANCSVLFLDKKYNRLWVAPIYVYTTMCINAFLLLQVIRVKKVASFAIYTLPTSYNRTGTFIYKIYLYSF